MALRFVVLLAVAGFTLGDQQSHVSISHGGSSHVSYTAGRTHAPAYHQAPAAYGNRQPAYNQHAPAYAQAAATGPYEHPPQEVPECAALLNRTWCLEDEKYPTYEINHAAQYHGDKLLTLYADVADLSTEHSVDGLKNIEEETYLCPSATSYVKPLRAQNSDGKWRVIVNNIELHYNTILTQTTRLEECSTGGEACPLVPICYESRCLQKLAFHRFLVFDPYDQYFPFAIESFSLPASCACLLGEFQI